MRIAIAEARPELFRVLNTPNVTLVWRHNQAVVDPLSDLNAMHEAWCLLSDSNKAQFARELRLIVFRDESGFNGEEDRFWLFDSFVYNATAVQRAEAFCRTLFPERFTYNAIQNRR